jgi:hypothetical protein
MATPEAGSAVIERPDNRASNGRDFTLDEARPGDAQRRGGSALLPVFVHRNGKGKSLPGRMC